MSVGARIAGAWTRLYTAGLPAEAGCRRRAEVASDVWEQAAAARAEGRGAAAVDASILSRCVRGMPADLAWRRGRARRAGIAGRVAGGLGWTVAALGYVLLVGTSASAAATFLLSAGARSDPLWVRWTALLTAILLTQIAGALIGVRRPRAGFVVLAAGVWSVAAVMWWAWPIAVPAATAASVGLHRLARRRTKSRPLPV